jgi:hypothetical protein
MTSVADPDGGPADGESPEPAGTSIMLTGYLMVTLCQVSRLAKCH